MGYQPRRDLPRIRVAQEVHGRHMERFALFSLDPRFQESYDAQMASNSTRSNQTPQSLSGLSTSALG